MISHIYVALGRWDESSTANETAWSVSQERVKRKGLGTGQLDFHSFFWLHYSYLQQGRYREAEEMLKVVELASHAEDQGRLGSTYGRMRAQQLIETRNWKTQLPDSAGTFSDLFADALIALNTGSLDEVRQLATDIPRRVFLIGVRFNKSDWASGSCVIYRWFCDRNQKHGRPDGFLTLRQAKLGRGG